MSWALQEPITRLLNFSKLIASSFRLIPLPPAPYPHPTPNLSTPAPSTPQSLAHPKLFFPLSETRILVDTWTAIGCRPVREGGEQLAPALVGLEVVLPHGHHLLEALGGVRQPGPQAAHDLCACKVP